MENHPLREHRMTMALRAHDLDTYGHVNQAVYHEFLEEGRVALLADLVEERDFRFVLARVELDYRHEVRYADREIAVVTRVAAIGSKSLTLEHAIERRDGSIAAEGRAVIVAWDPDARGARAISDEERALLAAPAATGTGRP
jgi:acyl-CoA thioester hydrolase